MSMRLKGLVLALALAGTTAGADDCLDYSQYPVWLSGAFHLQGTYYVDLDAPRERLFAAQLDRIVALDVSFPANPTQNWQVTSTEYISGLGVHDDLMLYLGYVSSGFNRLHIFDISGQPQQLSVVDYHADFPSWAIDGDLAYLVSEALGLTIFDLSDPAAPVEIANLPLPSLSAGADVAMRDSDLLCVLDSDGHMVVVDVGDPLAPHSVSQLSLPAVCGEPSFEDSVLMVPGGYDGLFCVDLSDETQPVLAATLPLGGYTSEVALRNQRAWCQTSGRLTAVDISDPLTPDPLFDFALPYPCTQMVIDSEILYMACSVNGVQLISLPDCQSLPAPAGYSDSGTPVKNVVIDGDLAWTVVDGSPQVELYSLSNPLEPAFLATVSLSGYIHDIELFAEDYLLVSQPGSFEILDRLTLQTLLVEQIPAANTNKFTVSGDCLYIATGGSGVLIYDLADPLAPTLLGVTPHCNFTTWALDVAVFDDYLYAAAGFAQAVIFDISNPSLPLCVGGFGAAPGSHHSLSLFAHMLAISVTNSSQDDFRGLSLFDLSEGPSIPIPRGDVPLPFGPTGRVDTDGSFAYVPCVDGVYVMDATSYLDPQLVGFIETGDPEEVVCSGGRVYVADREAGLLSIWPGCGYNTAATSLPSSGPRLMPAQPNPFNPNTRIAFEIAESGEVGLAVYDIKGRAVRHLISGNLEVGWHSVTWDGKDDNGQGLTSGVYLYHLTSSNESRAGKAVLLK